jgi:hypothetical protein
MHQSDSLFVTSVRGKEHCVSKAKEGYFSEPLMFSHQIFSGILYGRHCGDHLG